MFEENKLAAETEFGAAPGTAAGTPSSVRAQAQFEGRDESAAELLLARGVLPDPDRAMLESTPGVGCQVDSPEMPSFGVPARTTAITSEGFRYDPGRIDTLFANLKYVRAPPEPEVVQMNFLDRCKHLGIRESDGAISNADGWRSARANVNIRAGSWYWEVDILRANEEGPQGPHVRIGCARREASLEAPVGSDAYGYGLRDATGEAVTIARRRPFGEPFQSGDVIGLHINIPARTPAQELPYNVYRTYYPLYQETSKELYLESFDYLYTKRYDKLLRTKETPVVDPGDRLPGSYLAVYKNGRYIGKAFEGLLDFMPPFSTLKAQDTKVQADDGAAGYYPMLSSFRHGVARIRGGPAFKYDLPAGARPLCERIDEMAADSFVLDVLDDVEIGLKTQDMKRIKLDEAPLSVAVTSDSSADTKSEVSASSLESADASLDVFKGGSEDEFSGMKSEADSVASPGVSCEPKDGVPVVSGALDPNSPELVQTDAAPINSFPASLPPERQT